MQTSELNTRKAKPLTCLLLGSVALALATLNAAASGTANLWTNAAGDLLWSTPLNWNNNVAAGSTDAASFDSGIGATNGPGLVNNIVDLDTTVQQLRYSSVIPAYHTTLINPGVTLTVYDPLLTGEIFAYRAGGLSTDLSQVAIRGAGRLVVGDTNAPATVSGNVMIRVNNASTTPGPYWATLDMSGLDYFACAPSEIRVGASGSSAGTQGTWIMAKTNLVIVGSTSGSSGNVGWTIGLTSSSTDYGSAGDVQLGQENVLQLYSMTVGRTRATNASLGGPGGGVGEWSKAGAGGTMEFRSALVNPTLRMRGVDGVSPVQSLLIGDNNYVGSNNSTNTSTGVMDLSGGTVDILASGLYIGRNNGNTTTTRTGSGLGVLTWTAGTIEATTLLRVGVQAVNNAGNATGVINVRSNAVLNVTGPTFNLGNDAGSAAGTGNGTLNIVSGGVVTAAGDIAEASGTGGNGTSTINLTDGTLSVGGLVRVDNLTASNAMLSLTAGPTINAANPVCDVSNLTLAASVTLNVTGSVSLAQYPLIRYKGSIGGGGYGVVALGTLPPEVSAYLSNNTANSSIDLVVTSVPAVKWVGTVNGDWDINLTTNWISTVTSAAATYTETAIPGDPVIFDDTAAGTRTVNLTTVLSPATVIVNSTRDLRFHWDRPDFRPRQPQQDRERNAGTRQQRDERLHGTHDRWGRERFW